VRERESQLEVASVAQILLSSPSRFSLRERRTSLASPMLRDQEDLDQRELPTSFKTYYKSPSIQRLVTEKRLRRKVVNKRDKKANWNKSKTA